MKPVVGVTPNYFDPDREGAPNPEGSYYLNRPYVEALKGAGAIPLSLPYLDPGEDVERLLDRLDGVVMTGGFDVDMRELGEELHPRAGRVHRERLLFEMDLCRRALARDLPFLGICLGLQTLNLAFGGGLVQHIEEGGAVDHARPEEERLRCVHEIRITEGSLLHRLMGKTRAGVNSLHHQAAGSPGEGLRVTGVADDGTVEAMERPGARFCLGVQWHPEELRDRADHLALYEGFVESCRGRGRSRREGAA